jgi:type I restriction enzyme S subunit
MFVDGIDKENLPEGWKMMIIDDVFDFKYGKTLPSEFIKEEGNVPVYGANGIIGYYDEANCFDFAGLVTSRGNGSGDVSRTYHKESFVTNNSFVVKTKEQYKHCGFEYAYYLLKSLDFKSICTGSAQPQLTNMSIHLMSFALPDRNTIMVYCERAKSILKGIDVLILENSKLTELQSLLLARMGK